VNAASGLRLFAVLLSGLRLVVPSAGAQHVLVAEDGGQMFLVCSANGAIPRVQKEGKIVSITPHGFALREVPEFAPIFVTIRNVNVRTTSVSTQAGEGQLNNNFCFNADFESARALTDVFVVIALDTERAGKTLFLWEIGTLEAHKPKSASIVAPMNSEIGSGHYQIHLFAGGAEVMQSLLSSGESEMGMDRMVASRIKDVHNAGPKFFFGPAPEYPPELRKANLKGQAIVSVRIGANGAVFDPIVKSATNPAFGEAALQAVKSWRFLPRVKDDYPVEIKVDVPIVFAQPIPAAGSS
jgi:TonB family protein